MGKKLIITESQLKKLIQNQSKDKLNEGVEFGEMMHDTNEMDEPTDDLGLDVVDGKFVDKDEEVGNPIDSMQEYETEENSISLNEGQLKLKDTFNKLTGNPIIKSLSSEIIKK
jgi:hypothetical protein